MCWFYRQSGLHYTHDGDDQCVSTFQTGATAPTYSIYDGDYPFLQLASDGSVASVSDFGANGLFAKDGHFYLWDPSGNACQRLTSTGTVEYTRYVDAFGNVTKTDSITDSYGGMGGQWGYVTEGPFYRLGLRFYDPATGRFLTRDPIGYDGGINLYGYVENDPVDDLDPSGTIPVSPYRIPDHYPQPPPTLDEIVKDLLKSAIDPPPPPHGIPTDEAPGPPIAETEQGAADLERWLLKRVFRRSSAGRALARAAKAAERATPCPPSALTTAEEAAKLGYGRGVPPNQAPFNSHGQDVFFRNARDVDAHNVTSGWKRFTLKSGNWEREGTYDAGFNRVKD